MASTRHCNDFNIRTDLVQFKYSFKSIFVRHNYVSNNQIDPIVVKQLYGLYTINGS